MKTQYGGKIESIQTLRALAFLIIFSGHAGLNKFSAGGVSIFLVLSGFLMMLRHHDEDIPMGLKKCLSFSVRRIRKLYPLHVLMLVAALPFAIFTCLLNPGIDQILQTVASLFCDALLVQSWVPTDKIYFSLNSLSWYLSTYLFVCALFPLILSRLKESKKGTAIIRIIITFGVQIAFGSILTVLLPDGKMGEGIIKWATYVFPIFRLGDFYIGCNLYTIFKDTDRDGISIACGTFIEVAAIVLYAASQFFFSNEIGVLGNGFAKWTVIYEPGALLLVYAFAMNKGVVSGLLTNRAMIGLGNLSGFAFLIHQIVLRYISSFGRKILGFYLNSYVQAAIGLIITIALSLGYRTYEKYFRARRKRFNGISKEE